ncbi:TPA: hypothetical protein PXL63_004795 [Escherichia coli]|nr:hypothetical protein [Escherichia coli]
MANVSIREAVKLYQVSRPTLTKSLKNGKISGVQDDKGQWQIDPAELARVYKARTDRAATGGQVGPDNFTSENTHLPGEVDTLKARLAEAEQRAAVAEALAEERGKHIEDLRRMLPAPQEAQRPGWRWPWKR